MDTSPLNLPLPLAPRVSVIDAAAVEPARRSLLKLPGSASDLWPPSRPATPTAGAGHFGDRLVQAMHWRGDFKATALACALGVNEAAISRWKRGGPITLANAVRLCDTLDVSMDWLVRGLGHPGAASWLGPVPTPTPTLPDLSPRTVEEMQRLLQFIAQQAVR